MPSAGRVALVGVLVLLVGLGSGVAQSPYRSPRKPLPGAPAAPAPTETPSASPAGPTLRVGALLPLGGAGAWYGEEMRQGLELAAAHLDPAPPRRTPAEAPAGGAEGGAVHDTSRPTEAGGSSDAPRASPALKITLDVLDAQPLNPKAATADFGRLAAGGARVVFTASPSPTLAIYPLAAARDILVVHQGLPTDRFPAASRTLIQLRPSAAARGETLAAYAWGRGVRRLASLAAGDEFGKTVRAAVSGRWRDRGASLVLDESLSLDAPDVPVRLTRLARIGPEAVCLAYRGPDLGIVARRLREAGYTGLLLGLDDDPAVLLAAGPALGDTLLLTDAFAPEPGSPGAGFARAYEAKFGRPPSRFAANAYDALTMIAQAARAVMSEGSGPPGGARLREALATRRTFPSVYGGSLVLRDDGAVERPLALYAVERGRATFVHHVSPRGERVRESRLGPADPWSAAFDR